MLIYTLKRLGLALLVTVTVSLISFMLLRVSGDPAISLAGEGASNEEIEFVRAEYGFDRPIIIQYFEWAGRAIQGDFGKSPYLNQPVSHMLKERMGVTLILGLCSLTFALVLSVPLGILAATRPNTWIDRIALTISVMGQAMPSFWFGLILIIFFGVKLRWLPISGSDTWQHFVLPTIALGYYATPAIMRLVRSGMLEVLASDHIRTARAKGLKWPKILFKHALRNAIIPVVALAAVQLGFMLGGSIVIESIFALNGLGNLAWVSIARSDLPVVQAIVLFLSTTYIFLTFLGDLLNAFLDPRIRSN
ncbi:AppB [Desulforapulum autotrophicum HRM2]|uniref:AppB n=1 Tax=Desulforapulum autotrophicum (strain ATCC 43914 / DSM 3382 / VKM B-1955 / HRM2) TaxID=177437 RepID=C0Q8R4_DESAH|nr:ABC transporter permease [Desulforapulum autotrophicum]ACN14404.1 AppB [Desulforapulum autotrophicum HRM2]